MQEKVVGGKEEGTLEMPRQSYKGQPNVCQGTQNNNFVALRSYERRRQGDIVFSIRKCWEDGEVQIQHPLHQVGQNLAPITGTIRRLQGRPCRPDIPHLVFLDENSQQSSPGCGQKLFENSSIPRNEQPGEDEQKFNVANFNQSYSTNLSRDSGPVPVSSMLRRLCRSCVRAKIACKCTGNLVWIGRGSNWERHETET